MNVNGQSVHEPEAELATLEEAREDAIVMRAWLAKKQKVQNAESVRLQVPLWVVIEAIEQMEEPLLRQVVEHAEKRLTDISASSQTRSIKRKEYQAVHY